MNNPPPIPNAIILDDHLVTPDMSAWAVQLLHDPTFYMFSQSGVKAFGALTLVARAEWHPPEPSIPHWHRGITLYQVTHPLAEGIDVSGYQTSVNWDIVSTHKSFAFIKATEGIHVDDKMYDSHYVGARRTGLYVGAYHFFHPEIDAEAQADHFLSRVKGKLFDLPPVLDLEVRGNATNAAIKRGMAVWLEKVGNELRQLPMVYTAPGFFGALGAQEVDADLWVAHWGVQAPHVPAPWQGWAFWQYGDDQGVPGIGPKMDVNRFNGTVEDLRLYAQGLERC